MWFSQITSQIGLNALYFILTLKIYELTSSNTAVSILILTFTVPSIFLGYIAGVYVDYVDLKKVLLLTNFFRAIAVFLLIFFIGVQPLLFLLVFFLAVATLFFVPAEGSAIPSLVSEKDLIAANSLFSLTLQTGLVVGFLIGGFSLKILGENFTLVSILVLFAISLLLNIFLPSNIKSKITRSKITLFGSFWQGLKFVLSTKIVRDSIFFLTLTTTIFFVLATIGPGYVDKVLQLDIKYSSALVIAPAVIGMSVGAYILGHIGDRFNERFLINVGLFGLGCTFLILANLGGANDAGIFFQTLSIFGIFFLGLENALITIPVTTSFQKNTPEELRGRAYGLLSTFISGVAALPVLLSGAIGDLFGVRSVLTTIGVIVIGFGIYRIRLKKV